MNNTLTCFDIKSSSDYFDWFFDECKIFDFWQAGLLQGSIKRTLQYILSYLFPVKEKVILDMGSGIGYFSKILKALGASPISIVNSEKCYKYQIERYDFKVLHESYLNTGLPDNIADTIIFLESFCYEEPQKTMLEVNRLLKPNGQLLIKDLAPMDKQGDFIEKGDIFWKTKFATISEIQHAVSQYLTIYNFCFLDCDTSQYNRFLETHLKNYHNGSSITMFPWYLLSGYKEDKL